MAELDRAGISTRMAQARETAGLTQAEIAELLEPKVHQRTVQDWERPKMHVVPFDRLDEWARLTQTTREWLLYGDETVPVDAELSDELARRHDEILARFDALDEQLRVLASAAATRQRRLIASSSRRKSESASRSAERTAASSTSQLPSGTPSTRSRSVRASRSCCVCSSIAPALAPTRLSSRLGPQGRLPKILPRLGRKAT